MRYTGPKARLSRREGMNLTGSPKIQKIMDRKPGIPGMHGGKRQGKMSEYAKQLREKQKARRIFGLSEKQFRKYFDRATSAREVTGDVLLRSLERRLDNVIYRSGLALTRAQARQFASHGLFAVNGRRVDVPSINVRPGDVVEVHTTKKKSSVWAEVREQTADYVAPTWMKVDERGQKVEIVELPQAEHFEQAINVQPIVEFYSR